MTYRIRERKLTEVNMASFLFHFFLQNPWMNIQKCCFNNSNMDSHIVPLHFDEKNWCILKLFPVDILINRRARRHWRRNMILQKKHYRRQVIKWMLILITYPNVCDTLMLQSKMWFKFFLNKEPQKMTFEILIIYIAWKPTNAWTDEWYWWPTMFSFTEKFLCLPCLCILRRTALLGPAASRTPLLQGSLSKILHHPLLFTFAHIVQRNKSAHCWVTMFDFTNLTPSP